MGGQSRREPRRPRVLLITPIAPAASGNGLAMRAGLLVEGLSRCADLVVAVVPVADPGCDEHALEWAAERSQQTHLFPLPDADTAVRGWLSSPIGRGLVAEASPLPALARLAPPKLGSEILRRTGAAPFDTVIVLRGYLAGTVVPFIEGPSRPRLLLDLDEDDEATFDSIAAMHRLRGEVGAAKRAEGEARAHGRLMGSTLPWFDRVLVASELECSALRMRRSLDNVSALVNAVTLPAAAGPKTTDRRAARFMLVGNLDYAPNRDAVECLVRSVFPAIRSRLPNAELHIAGAGSPGQIGPSQGVVFRGAVPNLDELYREATATIVPLRAGG
ncbi:MAG: glycosyltransferase family 4 protein, partial [bacterium]|nr:glycosyltransferase family 4 protein [bacterium]